MGIFQPKKKTVEQDAVPANVEQAIPIQGVYEDGIFLVGRNLWSKTFAFTDINYAVASREDKEGMFLGYSEILNSLDSGATTKITINNRRIQKSKFEERNMLPLVGDSLDRYRREYNSVLERNANLSAGVVQDKFMTITVEKKTLEEAKGYFNRVGAEFSTLFAKLGSKFEEVGEEDKIRMLYDFFHKGYEDDFRYDRFLNAKRGHDFKIALAPQSLEFRSDYFKMDGRFARALYLKDYANFIKDSFIAELTDIDRSLMLSIDADPIPMDQAVRQGENKLLAVETNISNWQRKQNQNNNFSAAIPYDMERQREESREFLNDLVARDQRMIPALITLVHSADSKEQLDADTESILQCARKHLCSMSVLRWQQLEGLNGYADGEYEVYYDGTDAVIVYTQLNKKLTTDNIDDMAGYVGALEVKTAVLCNGIFEVSTNMLTSDEYYDMNLRVGEVDEKITAVWVQNAENSMFGTTENNNMSIWFSIYNGKTWSEPACLKSNINTITDIEVGENGVVYITDTNNDLTTIGADKTTEGYSDRLITVLDMDGNVTLLTAEEAAYHDVSYFADEIVYYMGNNLYSIDTNAAYFDVAIAELTEDYTVLTDAAGNVKAVLFVNTVVYDEETDADGSNVFAIFCDGDKWGSPIQLTDFGEEVFVSAFDAIDFEDKMLVSVLLSEVEYSEEATDEYDNYTTTNRFETLWFEYPTDYVMDEATFDYESISPNGETTLTIQITNNGYKTINEVPVSIIRNGSEIVAETVSQFYNAEGVALTGGLLSGTSGYIKVTFNVGEADNALLYTVNVNGQTQDVQLWYSDFAVFGKQVLIGDTYHIVTRVTNNGYVSAAYTLTATLSGTEIYSQLTDELGYGETQYFTIPLECTLVGDGSDLVFVKVNADDEYMFSNNEAKINIAANEILTISTDSLSVWLSKTSATIDRTNLQDVELSFDETYTLVSATINDTAITELYSVSNSIITLDANALALQYGNGAYTIRFQFSDGTVNEEGNAVYKYATLTLAVTQTFTATWIVDGVEVDSEIYEIGSVPANNNPTKKADSQYTYSFIGWDSNNDGAADEITAIQADTTYVAIFSNSVNSYEVIWNVNGESSGPQTYAYGSMPSYGGEPTKPSDAQYDYVFAGWDNEVSAVTKDITYTAVFDAIVRKYNVTTIVDGVSSTSQVEYGSAPILTVPTKDSDVQYHYSFTGWTPKVSTVYGNQTYTAQFERTLRQYVVTWVVDGKETQTTYDYGTVPVFGDPPTKQGDKQYSYSFTGWDKEITGVNGDITYTAQFNESINSYTVSFNVNGVTYSGTYEYGAMPSYTGDTSKPNDEAYRYAFSGWDKEIVAVSEDMTYVAQYTAVLIGSATVSNTTFKTAWNCEFTTTISLDNVQNMSSTVFTINYNAWLVKLKSYVCCEGTRVIKEDEGYITVEVDGLSNAVSNNIVSLTFVTSDYAPIGESDFIYIVSEDKLTSNVGKLTLYQMGDVNMDGRVNTVDASMIQRYAVKKLELDDVQKVYANVNGDRNMDGSLKVNTIDASMIQRYAVKKIDELGNRITVTFIDGEEIVSLTLVKGSELNYEPADGYKWSLAEDRFVSVDFTTLTSDTTVYMFEQ